MRRDAFYVVQGSRFVQAFTRWLVFLLLVGFWGVLLVTLVRMVLP